MTKQEERGRLLTLVVACGLLLPNLLFVVVRLLGNDPWSSGYMMFPLAINVAISWCLFRGYNWARWYVVITTPIACAYLVVKVMSQQGVSGLVVISPFIVLYGALVMTLWRSSSVSAYFERETPERKTMLSLKD